MTNIIPPPTLMWSRRSSTPSIPPPCLPLSLKLITDHWSMNYSIPWLWSEALLIFAMSIIFYWHASQIEVFLEKPIHPHASRSTTKAWRQIPRNCQAISFYLSIKFFNFLWFFFQFSQVSLNFKSLFQSSFEVNHTSK